MAIPEHVRTNFNTLLKAATNGDLALLECSDAETSETRYVLCAVGRDHEDFVFIPFGHMAPDNPYLDYIPPSDSTG